MVVGYAYFLGLAYALCTKVDEFLELRLGGDISAKPKLKGCGKFLAKTGIISPSHGSDDATSEVKFYDGTQEKADPYIKEQTGADLAYKNTAYLVINGFIGDNVRSAPNYSAVVKRTKLTDWTYNDVSLDDIEGDANPASCLWYILTEIIGLDDEILDKNSFIKSAKMLYKERLGVSFIMGKSQEAKEWLQEILRTIDAVLSVNSQNGKLSLRLLRDDYSQKDLRLINESNINNLKFKRKSWDETYSRVTIKYTQRGSFSESSLTAINSATRQTLGFERAYSTEYMAITNANNANKILSRLMRKLTYPIANLKFNLSAEEFKDLTVGDVLLFSNTALNVFDMPIRVLNLGADKADTQTIEVEACEDVFALKNVTVSSVQEDLYKPLDLGISEFEYISAISTTAEMGFEQGVLPLMTKPKGFIQGVKVKDGLSGDTVNGQFFDLGELTKDFDITEEMGDDLSFEVKQITKFSQLKATRAGYQRLKFVCLIDNEFINYQFRLLQDDGTFKVKTLMRGLTGTKIASHKKGAKVWFSLVDANDLNILEIISPNTTLYFSAFNYSQNVTKKLSFAHDKKALIPYAPSNLQGIRNGQKVTLKWHNCVPLHGANFRNADNIAAGIDEGLNENQIIIKYNLEGKEQKIATDKEEIEVLAPKKTKFYLWQLANSYLSQKVEIEI